MIYDIIAWTLVLGGVYLFYLQFYLAGRFVGRVYNVMSYKSKSINLPSSSHKADKKYKKLYVGEVSEVGEEHKIKPTFPWEG